MWWSRYAQYQFVIQFKFFIEFVQQFFIFKLIIFKFFLFKLVIQFVVFKFIGQFGERWYLRRLSGFGNQPRHQLA